MDPKLVVAILLLSVSSVIGQTRSELEKKYGEPIAVYLVSESIWMTPEYTTDGQVLYDAVTSTTLCAKF